MYIFYPSIGLRDPIPVLCLTHKACVISRLSAYHNSRQDSKVNNDIEGPLNDPFKDINKHVCVLSQGMVLLHWASDRGDEKMVKMLLDQGADVNVQVINTFQLHS